MDRVRICALAFLIAITLVLVAPAMSQEGSVQEYFLDNGLQVLIKEVHTAPVVSVQLFIKVGSRWEYPGISGISHWCEHMCYRGTEDFTDEDMNNLLDSIGATLNGYTASDMTCYHQILPSQYFELALEIEASRLARSLFDPEAVDKERTVIISELEWGENDPEDLLYKELLSQAYRLHPYQFPTIGFRNEIMTWSREDLYNHYKEFYIPNNSVLVIVGDVDATDALGLVKRHFGDIERGEVPREVTSVEPAQDGERRFTIEGSGNTSHIIMGFHQPSAEDQDIYAMYVLDAILGGATGRERAPRLKLALVESGLCSSLYTYVGTNRDPSLFFIGATVAEGVSLQDVEGVILAELERIMVEPIGAEELEKATNQIMASLVYQNESISGQAQHLGRYACIVDWRFGEELLDNIHKVTAEQVTALAQKVLSSSNMTVGWYQPTGEEEGMSTGALDEPMSDPLSPQPFGTASWQGPDGSSAGIGEEAGNSIISELSKLTQTSAHSFEFERRILSNGLIVLVKENHSTPSVTLVGSVSAGSLYEPKEKAGLASLTARMLSLGNSKMDKLERFEALDFVGASLDFSGGVETIIISGRCLSKDFTELAQMLFADLTEPAFPSEEFELLKSRTLTQIDERYEDPFYVAWKNVREMVYGSDSPLGWGAVGSRESVMAIELDDVQRFYADTYCPERTIIVVVGDVDADAVFSAFEGGLGEWGGAGWEEVSLVQPDAPSEPKTETFTMPGKASTDIAIGFVGPTRHADDYYAARLLNEIFGYIGLGGRMGNYIRDELGLAYYAFTRFGGGLYGGAWTAHMGVNPANVERAVQAFLEELSRIVAEEVSEKEMEQAKGSLIGQVIVRLESNAGMANMLLGMEYAQLGDDYVTNYPQIIASLTKADLLACARRYLLPDGYCLAIAGP